MRVRTTIRPDQELEVTETEARSLRRQGLVLEEFPTPDPVPARVPRGGRADLTQEG